MILWHYTVIASYNAILFNATCQDVPDQVMLLFLCNHIYGYMNESTYFRINKFSSSKCKQR